MDELQAPFFDPQMAARYSDGPARMVPGLASLHQMTALLLAERSPENARVLVLGAGGGLELKALAAAQPLWTFDGVDPAQAMLDEAIRVLGPLSDRTHLHCGYIDDAPRGPFDAATCLLTLHFLAPDERRRTLAALHGRLKPGAPFVAAHCSFPQQRGERQRWLSRYIAFGVASGMDPGQADLIRERVDRSLQILEPDADEAILREAGFHDVQMFYAAFSWRGWVAYA
ncbi:MAG TPA: class I SAM-dependent methyltransferase [Methylomirabilota bacterium]|nr:class I SAM-dependent methyltransferase [Methylomirabilota bacterium]